MVAKCKEYWKMMVHDWKKGEWLRECPADALKVIVCVLTVFILSCACVKGCLLFALTNQECQMFKPCVPVLEQAVWPLFILILVFLFKKQCTELLGAIKGLFDRSYLPHSPAPLAGSGGDSPPISEMPESEADSNQKTDSRQGVDMKSVMDEHPEKVSKVLERLRVEYGANVVPDVAVSHSRWKADGFFEFEKKKFFVAVLPYELRERIEVIVSRMNQITLNADASDFAFVLIIYGKDDADLLRKIRPKCGTNIILRCETL